jgi:hypothetical protein
MLIIIAESSRKRLKIIKSSGECGLKALIEESELKEARDATIGFIARAGIGF